MNVISALELSQKLKAVAAIFIDGKPMELSDDEAHGIGLILHGLAEELKGEEDFRKGGAS